ncbi:lipoprotein-releasing ABC transporter permease subunit [Thermodesulfobacteriota bacterium]
MSFEFFIGNRYLRAKQKQTFISLITILSVAGVMLGVMALIVVIAVMAGFESDLKSRILGVESHIVVLRYGGAISDYRRIVKHVGKIEGVEGATPVIFSQIMLRSSSGVSGALLRGVDPRSAGQVIKNLKTAFLNQADQFDRNGESSPLIPKIILGKELAKNMGVMKNDLVYVISPRGRVSPIGPIPAMKKFRVVGFFESGMNEYDSTLAYVHLSEAQKILRLADAVTGVEIRVNDIYKANAIAQKIVAGLGFPYRAKDWMQMNKNLFSALKLEKTVMFIILALIVLVASFNIASTLIMMVMEKTKDIAILKAMGATDKSIRKIFIFKGMMIGTIGTTLGVGFGFILCKLLEKYKFIELPGDVYYITTLPVSLKTLDMLMIASAAMVICFLATIYPARQASQLNPVDAIRYG